MADVNGAGGTTLGALATSGAGRREWWAVSILHPAVGNTVPGFVTSLQVNYSAWSASVEDDIRVQVSTVDTFATTIQNSVIANVKADGTFKAVNSVSLTNGTTYYWRARPEPRTGETIAWVTGFFRVLVDSGDAHEYAYQNVGRDVLGGAGLPEYAYQNVGVTGTGEGNAVSESVPEYVYLNIQTTIAPTGDTNDRMFIVVTTGTPDPILFFLRPPTSSAGSGVDAGGFGFGDLQTTFDGAIEVEIEGVWVEATITAWQTFPAGPDAYTDDRVIDNITGETDVQQQRITFTVPGTAVPSGSLVRVRLEQ